MADEPAPGPVAPPQVPQFRSLAEAGGPESLTELLARDPEGFQRQDRDRIVGALREQRARLEAGAKAAAVAGVKSGPRVAKKALSLIAPEGTTPEDLGI